jgi:hypothetical protein
MSKLLPVWLAQLAAVQPTGRKACHWCQNLAWFLIGLLLGPLMFLLGLSLLR